MTKNVLTCQLVGLYILGNLGELPNHEFLIQTLRPKRSFSMRSTNANLESYCTWYPVSWSDLIQPWPLKNCRSSGFSLTSQMALCVLKFKKTTVLFLLTFGRVKLLILRVELKLIFVKFETEFSSYIYNFTVVISK